VEAKNIEPALLERLLMEQQDEITAHYVYQDIAGFVKDEENKKIIEQIAADEWKHYKLLKDLTGKELKAQKIKRAFYYWVIRIFGLTFGIKLMEKGESQAVTEYGEVEVLLPGIYEISVDEERHEEELIDMLDEERLRYMGSIVLGLNDALVELTGALAGYTFAFQNTRLIALTGLITGISASFSMAAYFSFWLCPPILRAIAFLAMTIALSAVPPIPTPIMVGGQGLGPAFLTVSTIKFTIPSDPSAGFSIPRALIFSLPKPLGMTKNLILPPGTISV